MANYQRTFLSSYWADAKFAEMSMQEKLFYIYLHTSDETLDTGAFSMRITIAAPRLCVSVAAIKKMIEKFSAIGLLYFDYNTQECVVLDYFSHHAPSGNLKYEKYLKDLKKIHSQYVLHELAEVSKKYAIHRNFFLALKDVVPEIDENEYIFTKTKSTDEELITAAQRGRDAIAAKRKQAAEEEEYFDPEIWQAE